MDRGYDPHYDRRTGPRSNPYLLRLNGLSGVVPSPSSAEVLRGNWSGSFAPPGRPVHLELGCGKGEFLIRAAAADPGACFVGLEIRFKRVHRIASEIVRRRLDNVRVVRYDINRVDRIAGPGEMAAVYIHFPDPWPKGKQVHNRFLVLPTVSRLHAILRPGGRLVVKTDSPDYFDDIAWLFLSHGGFDLLGLSRDWRELDPFRTVFQQKFERQGRPTHRLEVVRR